MLYPALASVATGDCAALPRISKHGFPFLTAVGTNAFRGEKINSGTDNTGDVSPEVAFGSSDLLPTDLISAKEEEEYNG